MTHRLIQKRNSALRRKIRVRTRIHGTATQPRLSVNVSNLNITVQLIDDDAGKTLGYATTVGQKASGTMTEKAALVGKEIAKQAVKLKVKSVKFDRGQNQYHSRLAALAQAAREGGLEF